MSVVLNADGAAKAWPLGRVGPALGGIGQGVAGFYMSPPAPWWWARPSEVGTQYPHTGTGSYESMYRTQPWVYVCVNKLARAVARLPLPAYRIDLATGDRDVDRESPLAGLLRDPWPGGSPFRLKEHIVGSMAIYGEALVVKWRPRRGAPVEELWPVPWWSVQPLTIDGAGTPIGGYRVTLGAQTQVFTPEEVVHFRWWAPAGTVSPLDPLAQALAAEAQAAEFTTSSFQNAIRPSGGLFTPRQMKDEQKEQLKAEVQATYGGPSNAMKVLLLDGGIEWKPFGQTAADAQMIETRKLSREEVCAVYDIPPPMVHILDRATFSNIDEQHRMLYQDTLGPWLTMIEETLQAQLITPDFSMEEFVEFRLEEVLRGDMEKRSQAYARLAAVYTPNEMRRAENLEPIDNPSADAIWMPLNLMPVGDADEDIPVPAEPTLEERRLAALLAVSSHGNGNGDSVGNREEA